MATDSVKEVAAPGDAAQFDLQREIADSEQKKPWQSGVYSKMLDKRPDFRTVLITMERGAHMKEHHTDGTISIHVLKGAVRVNVQGQARELRTAGLFTLGPSIKHDVESLDDSAFLLTISWPPSEKLRSLEHRGYGS
ncbi:MAG TPA: AraC family ligand binding domain-containing protein [Alloacidobacterium sp.]|jgi:quercetin dioxygenase-like cupin family protein|nr:AraC family ligand binding domain-containing protein [Alloacidobacterium sp.]